MPLKSFLPKVFRGVLLVLGILAPWFTWTAMHSQYKKMASTYVYSNIWSPLKISLSGGLKSGWQNPRTYCYKESKSIIIFLHVTNASEAWLPIEVCTFKLAAFHNNETGVCVLTAYPMEPHPKLTHIKNLEIAPLNFTLLFNDTPLAGWYEKHFSHDKKPSKIWMWELSDALRYTYLYKYGGKYMDTDSWTLRNLAPLQNLAGWQDGGLIANGVLFFEKGHPFIGAIMDNFTKYYWSGSWGSSGPYLVTRIHRSGQVDNSTYTLVQPHVFYPTHYSQNHYPFIASHNEAVKGMIKGAYALHLWRYMIKKFWSTDEKPPNGSFVDEMLNTICA